MRFHIDSDLPSLARYLTPFFQLAGRREWFRRAEQLSDEQSKSPFRWKIVRDYHWLELVISHQGEVFEHTGALVSEQLDGLDMAGLHFAAAVVEIHARLSARGRRVLEGRLKDGLNAENGFAPLYLELEQAQQLMSAGYGVAFPDMEGTGRADLEFGRNGVSAEVECKSISADAGRRIHRKDFYRLIEMLKPALEAHAERTEAGVIVATLRDRLPSNVVEQRDLRQSIRGMLDSAGPAFVETSAFRVEQHRLSECLANVPPDDMKAMQKAAEVRFGPACHVVGGMGQNGGGCFVVIRSQREDDTSKPLLEAMRKAADQLTRSRPSFIAVQFQDIEPADLVLEHLRRRMGILSLALFGHYGARHVNATYFCGFSGVVFRDGVMGMPGFCVLNPEPKYDLKPTDASTFLGHTSDADFAAAIGIPPPETDTSHFDV